MRRLTFAVGSMLVVFFLGLALLSLFWVPYDTAALDISARLRPMSWTHPLGTDHFGRDILSMLMLGAQTSIAVALVAVSIGAGLGVPLGLAAAATARANTHHTLGRFEGAFRPRH